MDTYGLDDNESRAKIGSALRDRWWGKYSPWAAVPVRGKGLHQMFTINGLGVDSEFDALPRHGLDDR